MKTCHALIALAAIPALLAMAQPAGKPGKPVPMSGAPAPHQASASQSLTDQEKSVWQTIKDGNTEHFAAMLADDFVLVTPDGFENKSQTIDEIKKDKLTSYTLSEWRTVSLGADAGVVFYKADQEWSDPAGKTQHAISYCTSTWRNSGGHWLAVAHQETDAKAMAAGEKK